LSQDHLGLFDTPPNREQVRLGLVVAGLFAAFTLVLLLRDVRLPEIGAFVPMADAFVILSELIAAAMLFAQAAVFRSRALTVLGAAYVFAGLLLIPHVLTFPGAFAWNGLLGAGVNTTSWIVLFRQAAFPIAVLLYIELKQTDSAIPPGTRSSPRITLGVVVAIALAAAVTLLTTLGQNLLPPFFVNRADAIPTYVVAYESVVLGLVIFATVALLHARSSMLDLWLLVAFWGFLIQLLLTLTLHGRFTVGWYVLYVLMLLSNLVVTLALMGESYRLYGRLALSTSARNRERENGLMSLDTLVAAISLEAGQPLTAVSIHARAALNRLMRPQPDVEKAIESLHAIITAGRRTTDAIKSLRPTAIMAPGGVTRFNLNDLARTTASFLERELAGAKISLQFALDEALPLVLADRTKLQWVLVNLLVNAIESLGATHGRPRRITVRTTSSDGLDVLLEVTDNGVGIAPGNVERIFEPFFTTKPAGVGLGLSLSRTIVDAHGGRLWATRGEPHGATFHVQLPCSDLLG
jgi:signal transduction histidine kinase